MPATGRRGGSTSEDRKKPDEESWIDLELGDEALALRQDGVAPREYFDLLVEKELHADAVRVLARLLPKRGAVAWVCSCLRSSANAAADAAADAAERECLEAAERWVADPSEPRRAAALAAADAKGFDSPCAWAAAAAGWSGGSLAPSGFPPVEPAAGLTAQAVAGAVIVLAATDPEHFDQKVRHCIEEGIRQLAP